MGMSEQIQNQQKQAEQWFKELRNQMVGAIQKIDGSIFQEKEWQRPGGGGGLMSILKGEIFEKVGVNISTVHGEFSEEFRDNMPGTEEDPSFWASGISVVAHMKNPKIAAAHFNTRYITTKGKQWFGGGCDLTPAIPEEKETKNFHEGLKRTCDPHGQEYYEQFKQQCDEYFYLKHRKEPRGIGGIFFDYKKENWDRDFAFVRDVGIAFSYLFKEIIAKKFKKRWKKKDKLIQNKKRGRYVEFNLLHDRGTKFGLQTGGNVEAILMSLPPTANWE